MISKDVLATAVDEIASIQARIDKAKQKQAASQRELELLEKDFEAKSAQVTEYGVESAEDLPAVIEELTTTYKAKQEEIDGRLKEIEAVQK
jgi:hypothetical protein